MTKPSKGAAVPAVFNFKSIEVRCIIRDGEPWFVASDIAKALGYPAAAQMTRILDDDERGMHIVHTPSNPQAMTIINESGLYHALLRSKKPEAQPFRKWVTAEVLPAIRKEGSYTAKPAAIPSPKALTAITGDLQARIDKRAWELAHAAYADYRKRMMDDVLVKSGGTTPEAWPSEWTPLENSQDVLESIFVTAKLLEAHANSINIRGRRLAEMVGKDYVKATAKYRPS